MQRYSGSSRDYQSSRSMKGINGLGVGLALFYIFLVSPVMADQAQQSGWNGAIKISNNNYVYPGAIASNSQGTAIAVWTQDDGLPQQYGVWISHYDKMKGWQPPQRINNYTGQADEVAVAMNEEGRAVVAWVQYSNFDYTNPSPVTTSLWISQFNPETGWSSAKKLVDDSANPNFPQLAIAENGSVIATWQQSNNDLDITNIYAAHYDSADGWSESRLVQSDNSINATTPLIAMNGRGDAVIVYDQYHPAPDYTVDIGFNYYSSQSGWLGAAKLPESDDGNMPHAGIDERGNAVVVFGKGYPSVIYAVDYDTSQGWDKPVILQDPNNGSEISASNLQMAMNEDGEVFAIWKESAYAYFGDTTFSIHTNHLLPGKGWQGQQVIGTEASNRTVYDQLLPQIGVDGGGNAIAVWAQETGPDFYAPTHVLAFRYDKVQGWDAGQAIQQTTTNANNTQVIVNENGQAFAAWIEQDLTDFNAYTSLWANHFSTLHEQ